MQWILQEYNTEKYGSPSWKSLLKAVSKVDDILFDRLANEHQFEGECACVFQGYTYNSNYNIILVTVDPREMQEF